jgi:hypothetical protein
LRLPESDRGRYISHMPDNLSPEERGAVVKLLRETIAADNYPLSPRVRTLKSALAKLDPATSPSAQPIPPPQSWVNSGIGARKRRR